MIKLLFYALIFLILAVYVALIAREDPGYALISHGDWSIEGTLVLLISSLTVLICSILFILYLLTKTIKLPGRLGEWNQNRKTVKAIKSCNRGFIELAEGNFREAEKHLRKSANNSGMPVLNYLAAARAAQEEGAQRRRDDYLMQAHQSDPDADVAIGLTQAELQIKDGQAEQALATLMHLRSVAPKHKQVLKMLFAVYQELNSWKDIEKLLPELRKSHIFQAPALTRYEQSLAKQLMQQAYHEKHSNELKAIWGRLPKSLQQDPEMIHYYCDFLIVMSEKELALSLIKDGLKRKWSASLILQYGLIKDKDVSRQLEIAEGWAHEKGRSAEILLTLGRLSIYNQLWGKARDYLKESIAVSPSKEAYQVLGELYEQRLDNAAEAMSCYREGLLLSEPVSPAAVLTEQRAVKLALT
jgi:HemY protein